MSDASTQTPKGWYPDPSDDSQLRWFDGYIWTAYTAAKVAGQVPPPPPGQTSDVPPPRYAPIRTSGGVQLPPADPMLDDELTSKPPRQRTSKLGPLLAALKPSQPDWFRWSQVFGWVLLAGAVVVLGLAINQNMLSGRSAADAQDELRDELAVVDVVEPADNPSVASALVLPHTLRAGVLEALPAPPVMPGYGEAVGRITIGKIGVDAVVSVGTDNEALNRGPGLWKWGTMPGSPGNASIAAHRTTYGSTFKDIDKLVAGDTVTVELPGRPKAVFEVRETQLVGPTEVGVTGQTDGVRLTLITCDPPGSTTRRLVVQAELIDGEFDVLSVAKPDWKFQR